MLRHTLLYTRPCTSHALLHTSVHTSLYITRSITHAHAHTLLYSSRAPCCPAAICRRIMNDRSVVVSIDWDPRPLQGQLLQMADSGRVSLLYNIYISFINVYGIHIHTESLFALYMYVYMAKIAYFLRSGVWCKWGFKGKLRIQCIIEIYIYICTNHFNLSSTGEKR